MITRLVTLAFLLIAGAAVATDYRASGPAAVIRAGEAARPGPADDSAPSVAKVCGFAPCGMPLPCD